MLTRIFSMPLRIPLSAYIVAVSLIVAAGALGFMAVDRAPPIELISTKVTTLRVPPGGSLDRELRFIQHKRCNIHTERALYDSAGVLYPIVAVNDPFLLGELGVEQAYTRKVKIPNDMAFGIARFERRSVYRCNPLHWAWPIYEADDPVFFEVIPL